MARKTKLEDLKNVQSVEEKKKFKLILIAASSQRLDKSIVPEFLNHGMID